MKPNREKYRVQNLKKLFFHALIAIFVLSISSDIFATGGRVAPVGNPMSQRGLTRTRASRNPNAATTNPQRTYSFSAVKKKVQTKFYGEEKMRDREEDAKIKRETARLKRSRAALDKKDKILDKQQARLVKSKALARERAEQDARRQIQEHAQRRMTAKTAKLNNWTPGQHTEDQLNKLRSDEKLSYDSKKFIKMYKNTPEADRTEDQKKTIDHLLNETKEAKKAK